MRTIIKTNTVEMTFKIPLLELICVICLILRNKTVGSIHPFLCVKQAIRQVLRWSDLLDFRPLQTKTQHTKELSKLYTEGRDSAKTFKSNVAKQPCQNKSIVWLNHFLNEYFMRNSFTLRL